MHALAGTKKKRLVNFRIVREYEGGKEMITSSIPTNSGGGGGGRGANKHSAGKGARKSLPTTSDEGKYLRNI